MREDIIRVLESARVALNTLQVQGTRNCAIVAAVDRDLGSVVANLRNVPESGTEEES